MKKILLTILICLSFISKVNASTSSAYEYVLMDQTTGRVLSSKNANLPRLIASITKIMTCLLAIESNKLDEVITVDESIKKAYGSGIYIEVGEKMTLRDMLYGLMLRSGNDAAVLIASDLAGTEEDFAVLMNNKAKEIGMKNTVFHNPSGLDNNTIGNTSTAYDMALLTSYAMQNKTYREIVKTKKYTAKTNLKTYIWHNKNKLLQYDYITGGKTGYTEKAKRTLVSTASKNNLNLVVVTIKDSDDWNTHKSLYEYAFDNYKSYNILNKKTFSIPKDKYYDSLYIKNDVSIILNINETKNVISHIKLEKKKHYKNNEKVGTSYIYVGKKLVHKEDIYARKTNKKESIFKRIF